MVTLDQIRQLDSRVHRAIELITKLREENYTLKNRLAEYQDRIEELEVLISNFKEDQGAIEQGIVAAITSLDRLDESARPAPQAKEAPAKESRPREPRPAGREAASQQGKPASGQRAAAVSTARPEEDDDRSDAGKPEAELDIF